MQCIVHYGKKMNKSTTFNVGSCMTRNISSGPTNFWVNSKVPPINLPPVKQEKNHCVIPEGQDDLDHIPVWGEYKRRRDTCLHATPLPWLWIPPQNLQSGKCMLLHSKKIKRGINLLRYFNASALHTTVI